MTTATGSFIEQLYTQFLGRESETEGKAYWQDKLDSGAMNAAEVTLQFTESAEYAASVTPVVSLYLALFGRTPDADGLAYWTQQLKNGTALQDIAAGFMDSDEYLNRYDNVQDDNDAFVDQLYQTAFGRSPSLDATVYWQGALKNNELNRAEVVAAFAGSKNLSDAKTDELTVINQYNAILGQTPTQDELASALGSNNPVKLITQLYSRDEYSGVDVPGLSKAGVVVDGYLKGATVTLTVTETIDGVETTRTETRITDANGNFDFGEDAGFGTLSMTGGTDISTGKKFEGVMSAPAGAQVINPLTTLVEKISQTLPQSDSTGTATPTAVANAMAAVSNRFGLDTDIDLTTFDPVKEALRTDTDSSATGKALAVQAAATQTNTLVTQIAALLDGVGVVENEESGNDAALNALADIINDETSVTVDLTSTETVQQLTTQAATRAGADENQQATVNTLASDTAQTITKFNQAIKQAVTDNDDHSKALGEIAQVQVVAEEVEEQLEKGAENNNLTLVKNSTEDGRLRDAIADQENNVAVGSGNGAVYRPEPDTDAPTIQSVVVNAAGDIEINYNEYIGKSTAEIGDYQVTVDGNAHSITDATINGTKVTLTSATKIHDAQTVNSVAYSASAGTADSVADISNNASVSQTITSITNNSTVDVTPPTISSIVVNADGDLELTYSEDVSGSNVEAGDYNVTVDNSANHAITSAAVNGKVVTLTTTTKIHDAQTVNSVAYTASAGTAGSIVDGSSNAAEDQTVNSITNNSTVDKTAPTISSVAVNAAGDIEITYNEAVGDSVAEAGDFTVTVDSSTQTIDSVQADGSKVTLTLNSKIEAGVSVDSVAYSASAGTADSVVDSSSNAAVDKTVTTGITNNSGIDTTAPAAPSLTLTTASDSGSSNSDAISNDTTPTVRVTLAGSGKTAALAGDSVSLLEGSTEVGSATLTADDITAGYVDITTSALGADGVKSLTATITDQASPDTNSSTASSALSYTLDTSAPSSDVSGLIDSVGLSADTGNGVSGTDSDKLTKTAAQTVNVALNNSLPSGEALYGSTDNGTSWTALSDEGSSIYALSNVTLQDGQNSLQFALSDVAGNVGTAASFSATLDTTAPTTTLSAIAISADSGSSNSDFITKTESQTITATLSSALVGDEALLGRVDGGNWVNITDNVTDTALNWDGVTLAAGAGKKIELKVTDPVGNDGTVADQAYTLDTTAPTTTITGAVYDADTNKLTLTGTNFADLQATGEDATTDIKARLDWTKLQWDINSDNTDNVTFAENDISSAKVSNGTTLQVEFTTTFADHAVTGLENKTGFDPLDSDDTIEVSAGFARDAAGNVSNSEVYDGPYKPIDVVFDLIQGLSSEASNRTFDANREYKIWILMDADSNVMNAPTKWSDAQNLGADDKIYLSGDDGRFPLVDSGAVAGDFNDDGSTSREMTSAGDSNDKGVKLNIDGVISRPNPDAILTDITTVDIWDGQLSYVTLVGITSPGQEVPSNVMITP